MTSPNLLQLRNCDVRSSSHNLDGVSLEMNGADSFVTIHSNATFDFASCVLSDQTLTTPLVILNGGHSIFKSFVLSSTIVRLQGFHVLWRLRTS
ncbi:hypothetical protein BLNAU_3834 [Blattamonas nauphoetae]|uniref:Dispersed gene family protein 1 (DGF-1) n=1 Tax=Blattamonas nauphoetae TaxID=2049346 RepID=A0ABQ9YBB5_9EUKA|nr:hypothetical protein BLNAU_3834 [Blattamonas nauphoetae]